MELQAKYYLQNIQDRQLSRLSISSSAPQSGRSNRQSLRRRHCHHRRCLSEFAANPEYLVNAWQRRHTLVKR